MKEKGIRRGANVIARKLLRLLLLLLFTSMTAFVLMKASPIDPLQANVGQTALGSMSAEQVAKLEAYWRTGENPLKTIHIFGWEIL